MQNHADKKSHNFYKSLYSMHKEVHAKIVYHSKDSKITVSSITMGFIPADIAIWLFF